MASDGPFPFSTEEGFFAVNCHFIIAKQLKSGSAFALIGRLFILVSDSVVLKGEFRLTKCEKVVHDYDLKSRFKEFIKIPQIHLIFLMFTF